MKILSYPHFFPLSATKRTKTKKSKEKEIYKAYGEGHGDGPVSPMGMIFIVIYVS